MQWGIAGSPNWYAPKVVAAFGIPLFFTLLNIVINLTIYYFPKQKNISKVMQKFVPWLIPVLSLIIVPLILFLNLGVK
jgi:membrane protein YdbS with pleckstrin-like domain